MSFKVAGVQMDIQFSAPEKNLESMFVRLRQTVSEGAALTVFPECTTTGYCFSSFDEAWGQAEPLDGASFSAVQQQCIELQTRVVFGMLERDVDAAGAKRIFNVVVLVGPSGIEGIYRKVHLPHLGVDRFTTSGEGGFSVVENELGRMGMNICYDSSFPEAARCLTLAGADLIILPTQLAPDQREDGGCDSTGPGAGKSCLFHGDQSNRGGKTDSNSLGKAKFVLPQARYWTRPWPMASRFCMRKSNLNMPDKNTLSIFRALMKFTESKTGTPTLMVRSVIRDYNRRQLIELG